MKASFPSFLIAALIAASTAAIAQSPAPAPVAAPTVTAKTAAATSSGEHQMEGVAAYYSNKFNGRKTASGQRFNNGAMTAAHNTLPFGTRVKITNVKNNRSVVVRINDRGPTTPGRVFDLTRAAASKIGYVRSGLTDVRAEIVSAAPAKRVRKAGK
jgi:rare lipoprotein A